MNRYKEYIKKPKFYLFLVFIIPFLFISKNPELLYQQLLDNSVMVMISSGGHGSGTIFVNDNFAYIWTCQHVAYNSNANITVKDNSGRIFKTRMIVSSEKEDIALLKIIGKSPFSSGVVFNNSIPSINSIIYHIGSPAGKLGFNSFFEGKISAINRFRNKDSVNRDGFIYDQINCTAFFGCSGGGIFNSNGEYIGLIAEFLNDNTYGIFCVIPTRRITEFAIRNHVEYAVNHNYTVPIEQVN